MDPISVKRFIAEPLKVCIEDIGVVSAEATTLTGR